MNKHLYFYHLMNKDADLSNGLISLQYMYDHKLYDLFDKNVEKYKERITNFWGIEKYKGLENLSRKQYLDGLNIFRGKFGTNYIYFFKYPPTGSLGENMQEILRHKDVYKIDLEDENVKNIIDDIFWGFRDSNSDNEILTKDYYETVSKSDYFKNYDDKSKMNYTSLNHIGIAFKNGICPKEFLIRCV